MEKDESKTYIEYGDAFVATLKRKTALSYQYALNKLVEFITSTRYAPQHHPPYPIACLRDDIIWRFDTWLKTHKYSPATRDTYIAALKRFLVWLDAGDHLPNFQVGKAISRFKAVRGNERHSKAGREPDPEVPKIVTYYDSMPLPPADTPAHKEKRLLILRARAIAHTLYATAARVSEVAKLTREKVLDGRAKEVRITGKGDKDRMILLMPEAQKAIAAYCRERGDDGYEGLFIAHGTHVGKPLSRTTLWQVVKDAANACGLYKNTSPHAFRHYRAQQLLNEGMDLAVLQAYLGHEDIGTTRRIYAPHTDLAKVRQQLAKYSKSPQDALSANPTQV